MKITKGDISFEATDGGEWYGFWPSVQADSWEPHTYQTFKRFLDKDHSYVDIGAWIGPTVMYGCQLAKHCYAVEPDPVALKLLKKHLAINSFTNVTLFEGAIAEKDGEVQLGCMNSNHQFQLGESMTSTLFNYGSFMSPCLTLEEFFQRHNITDCNFIKMDIEGGEFFVLPQAWPFLEQQKIPLYLAIHGQFMSELQRNVVADILQKYRLELTDGPLLDPEQIRAGGSGEVLVFF